jgi:hypothetical protein
LRQLEAYFAFLATCSVHDTHQAHEFVPQRHDRGLRLLLFLLTLRQLHFQLLHLSALPARLGVSKTSPHRRSFDNLVGLNAGVQLHEDLLRATVLHIQVVMLQPQLL